MRAENAEPEEMNNSCYKEVFMNERSNKVDIIEDADGKSIVVINDLRFKGRRSVDWNVVEDCLKEYIGEFAEITETSDVVYIGADFPDEFAHSKDTKELRGGQICMQRQILQALSGR